MRKWQRDAVAGNIDGNLNPNDIGNAFILPSSYIGSPRNMQEYIQDAMTYVRHYGRPDLFITFTCNPNWEEIQTLLLPGQQAIHRHDLTARVFKQKLKSLIDVIVKYSIFGITRCWLYTIEWQKRGLPHAHILVWLKDRIRPEEIDQIISAEIPDPLSDQELFDIVTKHMIHGPCGAFNMTSPCMENGKCKKKFPKPHTNDTITNIDGYPMYRRRSTENGGHTFTIRLPNFPNQVEFDNHSVKSIKYICKYVNKGSDLAIFEVQNINKNDEIARYQMGRYISSNEAIWHILSFPNHERDPAVQHLAIHLENGQRVYFTEENVLQRAFEAPKTTLTEFFTLCQKPDVFGQFAKTLVYGDVPRYFTWNKSSKKWEPRKQGKPHPSITGIFKAKTLGRLYTVHPKQRTYQDACRELQLLEDDNHWDLTLADTALTSTPNNIQDTLHRIRQTNQCQNIDYTPEMYNEALVLIEDLCVLISNLPLNHYGMPSPNRPATDLVNTDLQRENQYDHGSLATIIMNSEPLLTGEQKNIYDRIMLAVAAEQGGFFFLDAPGGTGKTFLISLILAKIRSQQKIALAVASSGIAATLLDGGRTAHSTFKLPLDVHNKPDAMCNIKKNSGIAAVLRKSSIIIWDECTMAHKYSLEALNRTMQDLNSNNKLFGGAILLLSGDFRQTLPSTFPDIQNNYLNHEWLSQRAILAAKNVDVDEINFQLLPGDLMSFKSIDTVVDENESVNFPIEFLNSLDIPGMPPHNILLKIGSPIILLRNLNPPQLCNGTRLVIKKITGNILEATILAGKFKGKVVLLPRIPMIPSDSTIPFKRLQFPIRLAFAMSINKSQGQTMSICGLDLENPCFSHGQLYVACSRVGKPSNLFVLAKDRLTKNIVHRLVLH
ncbi:unnamed protein product [Arctia plantaginis]|uniref:ATP-dependent DNA helicase n=1 Tax=Arctia plantaginis TaxID=874455 RepID=A0A8S1AXU9_ARCPL|nr:unnamed protein product [Arctia plantaginis]